MRRRTSLIFAAVFLLGVGGWLCFKSARKDDVPSVPPQRMEVEADMPTPAVVYAPEDYSVVLQSGVLAIKPFAEAGGELQHVRASERGIPWLVQFAGPITAEIREALAAGGGVIRAYLPTNALLVEAPVDIAARWGAIPGAVGLAEYAPENKIAPALFAQLQTLSGGGQITIHLQTFSPADVERVAAALEEAGAENIQASPGRRWGTLTADVEKGIPFLAAALPEVQWVEAREPMRSFNESARVETMLDYEALHLLAEPDTLDGRGQIIGHADSGLDTGNTNTLHRDFAGRVIFATNFSTREAWSDLTGHGTHTAGSILGSGAASEGLYRGAAPAALLIHQALGRDAGIYLYPPDDLYDLFEPAYLLGARIHANSWGGGTTGEYTLDSQNTDAFAWDHPDMLIVFAAGNDGVDNNRNGVIDATSLGAPGTAKNALTVGASENRRERGTGGSTGSPYRSVLSRFQTDPIASDYLSEPYDGVEGHTGMAAYSSRGPAADGRTKPDIVGPGNNIISTRAYSQSSSLLSGNTNYAWKTGTSMATPLIAGAAALLRQHCGENLGLQPSAALLRAALTGGARSLHPGQYGTNQFLEIPAAYPNSVEGWGMPDIARTVAPVNPLAAAWYDSAAALDTGGTFEMPFLVTDPDLPLAVALSWTDVYSTPAAATHLVQDLDLRLTPPSGGTLFPNSLVAPDRLNVIECIRIPAAETGLWTVAVSAHNTPMAAQHFALYTVGAIQALPHLSHTVISNRPLLPETNTYALSVFVDSAGMPWATNTLTLHYSTDGVSFSAAACTHTASNEFSAEFPAVPLGSTNFYAFSVSIGEAERFLPEGGTNAPFQFIVQPGVSLHISGDPQNLGDVSPPYGGSIVLLNEPIDFSASATMPGASAQHRVVCAGWSATGMSAANGTGNTFTATPLTNATLMWHWRDEYQLIRSTTPGGLVESTTNWVRAQTPHLPPPAVDILYLTNTAHGFFAWSTNGLREPAPARLQHPPLLLDSPLALTAHYMPAATDEDANGLADYFELRYFGATGQSLAADPDGDGFSNQQEFLAHTDPLDSGSYPTGPVIMHTPLPDPQAAPSPWAVTADITDPSGIITAILYYRQVPGAFIGHLLTPEDADAFAGGVFTGTIPTGIRTGATVEYYLFAVSRIGGLAYSPTNTFTVAYPCLDATYVPLHFVLPNDTRTNTFIAITNTGHAPLVYTLVTTNTGYTDDAEILRLTTGGANDAWHPCDTIWTSPSNSWHFAIELNDGQIVQTPPAADAWLSTPPIFLATDSPRLTFQHWLDAEPGSATEIVEGKPGYYDSGFIEITTNAGATWQTLTPDGGYPAAIIGHDNSPYPGGTPVFANTTNHPGVGTDWETVTADLTPFAGQAIKIRWRYGTDLYTQSHGWFIDDIAVTPRTLQSGDFPWLSLQQTEHGITVTADSTLIPFGGSDYAEILIHHNAPETPSPLRIPVSITNTARQIHITAQGPGQTTPLGSFILNPPDILTLTNTADPGAFLFTLQQNSEYLPIPSIQTQTNITIPAPLPQPTTLHIIYAPLLEGVTVSTDWLAEYHLTNHNWMTEALLDHDQDGLLTWQEYQLSSAPTNPADAPLRLLTWDLQPGTAHAFQTTFHIFTNTGDTYHFEYTTNLLTTNWHRLLPALTTTHPITTHTAPTNPGYYRLRRLTP